jgi:hypothetical protein
MFSIKNAIRNNKSSIRVRKILWKVYYSTQPLRCIVNYHDLDGDYGNSCCYSCRKCYNYDVDVVVKNRFTPWRRKREQKLYNFHNYCVEILDVLHQLGETLITREKSKEVWEDLYKQYINEVIKQLIDVRRPK